MKKFLPKTINNPRGFLFRRKIVPERSEGFTLVELLVVISIIAILSVVGITVFNGVQQNAREARRRADITALSNAYETHYDDSAANYPAWSDTWMSSGAKPVDPKGGGAYSTYNATTAAGYTVCASMELTANGNTASGASFCMKNQR